MQTLSMRGKAVDMNRLIAQNSHKRALGNANMNARGDILDQNGTITVSRESVAREYHKTVNPKAVKQVPLRSIRQEAATAFDTPAQAVAKQKAVVAAQKTKRKIVEGE
jgi:hypothetical protein